MDSKIFEKYSKDFSFFCKFLENKKLYFCIKLIYYTHIYIYTDVL